MQNQFYNQPVVDWAKQNLSQPVEIKVRFSSHTARLVIYALLFLVPVLIIACLIFLKLTGSAASGAGWPGIFLCGGVMLVPSLVIVILGIMTQQGFAKSLDATGVKASKGRQFRWENLYYVNHVSKHTRTGGVSRVVKDNQLELVFADGKTIIPPLIENREQIWNLINSMPAQVKDDGQVRAVQTDPEIDNFLKALNMK